jgi:hypothetical protein
VNGANIFAGTDGGGIFLSINNGSTWVPANLGLTNLAVRSLVVSGTNIFAGTFGGGVFLSTDMGASWSPVNLGMYAYVQSLAVSGLNIFAGTLNGVFRSNNNGTTWTQVNYGLGTGTIQIQNLSTIGTNVFALQSYWYVSENNGVSWNQINNTGLPNSDYYNTIAVSGTNICMGLSENGVWRRLLSDIVSIKEIANKAPLFFNLAQNYPNPIKSLAKIQFSLPYAGFVTLKIFDSFGKEIRTLLSENLFTGKYDINWDTRDFISGTYFYRLQVNDYKETKKITLIK